MSAAQLPPGTVIDGRYTLGAAVRSRPGATVHVATDPSGAEVHVTIYSAECFPSALVRERSLRELRQLESLSSPRVLPVLGCGKLDDGGAYEINAATTDRALSEGLFARGPWPPADAALERGAARGARPLNSDRPGTLSESPCPGRRRPHVPPASHTLFPPKLPRKP